MQTLFDANGNELIFSEQKNAEYTNCKIIAHRGYHVNHPQNTKASFAAAIDNGFKYLEIDIRKCSDGVYVLSHDASVTLYNNGTAKSINIPNTAYSTIKGYTWDSAGKYPIETLLEAWNELKCREVWYVCDLKNGSNADVVELAEIAGVLDKIILSYGSGENAVADAELLNQYKYIPIRAIPTTYTGMVSAKNSLQNPVYADVNASETAHYQQYLNIALSANIPILFSGTLLSNKAVWSVVCAGVMANLDENISHADFVSALTNDFSGRVTITPSVTTASIAKGGSTTVTATSDSSNADGYIYAKSLNPGIVTVKQTTFGKSISAVLTAVAAGSATVRLFNGGGAFVDIAVTVS